MTPQPSDPVLIKRNHWCEPGPHNLRYSTVLRDGVFIEAWGCVNCDTLLRRETLMFNEGSS